VNKVGEPSVSPYLLQPLRTEDEAKDARAQRRREPDPVAPKPAAEPAADAPKPAGPGIDRKV
jgi:hypothetical protein